MNNLKTTIDELRKSIAADEKSLAKRKEGLALLEKASGKLSTEPEAPLSRRKYTRRSVKEKKAAVTPAIHKVVSTPLLKKARPAWTAERRAKAAAARKKTKVEKDKAAQ